VPVAEQSSESAMVSTIARSVKSAFPRSPEIVSTMKFSHKLRWFIGSTTSTIFVTASNFGFAVGAAAGAVASNLSTLSTSFRLKNVTVFGTIDLDSSGAEGLSNIQIKWVDARTPAISKTGIATAGVPMRTSSKPPKNSFAGMWVLDDFTANTTIVQISFPTYFSGILEIDCDMTLLDADHTLQYTTSATSVTVGRIYQTNFAQSTVIPIGYYSAAF
jgi:hypothetical protein